MSPRRDYKRDLSISTDKLVVVNDPQPQPNTILSVQLPLKTKAELERAAAAGYRSVSAEVRLALDAHLKQKEQ
jgi:TraY domain-containing protein